MYDGRMYLFTSDETLTEFVNAPQRYLEGLAGGVGK
jgi:YHS domain-containing protein